MRTIMAFSKQEDGDDGVEVTVRGRRVEQHGPERGVSCCFGKVVVVSMLSLIVVAICSLPYLWSRISVSIPYRLFHYIRLLFHYMSS